MKLSISNFSELGNLIGMTGVVDSRQAPTNNVPHDAFEADLDALNAELPRRSYAYWGNPEEIWENEGL